MDDTDHCKAKRLESADGPTGISDPGNQCKEIKISRRNGPLKILVQLDKQDEMELSNEAPHAWKISGISPIVHFQDIDRESVGTHAGDLRFVKGEASLPEFFTCNEKDASKPKAGDILFFLDLIIYLCNKKSGVCSVQSAKYAFKFRDSESEIDDSDKIVILWKI